MQSPTLPIQISGASPAAAPARAKQNSNGNGDGQFSAALQREVGQRQKQPGAAAPAKMPEKIKPVDSAKPAQAADASPAPAGAGSAPDDAVAKAAAADAAAAQAAAGTTPAELGALMASLTLPVQTPATTAAPVATTPVEAAALPELGLAAAPQVDGAPAAAPADTEQDASGFGALLARADQGKAASLAAAEDAGLQAQGRAAALPADARAELPSPALRARDAALPDIAPPAPAPLVPTGAALGVQQAAAALGAGPQDKIAARVGTPAWDNQVGQKIVWMIAGKEQSATLTLNPPDLGPMQVVLSVTNDQANVTFSAAQPEVRQALEDAMPKLRDMLGENGLALNNASVNDGARDRQQAQADARAAGGRGRGGMGGAEGGTEADGGTAALPQRRAESQGLVDTYV